MRKAGNKIRVTAQLIDASTEDHVWSDNYDRQLDDVFSIQSEIAKSVSEALMSRLLPKEEKSIEKKSALNSAGLRALPPGASGPARSFRGRIEGRKETL